MFQFLYNYFRDLFRKAFRSAILDGLHDAIEDVEDREEVDLQEEIAGQLGRLRERLQLRSASKDRCLKLIDSAPVLTVPDVPVPSVPARIEDKGEEKPVEKVPENKQLNAGVPADECLIETPKKRQRNRKK